MSLAFVAPDNGPWALHDIAASRVAEQAGLAATPPHALMQRAGEAVARLAAALAPHAQRFVVYAGPGNNGGDGLVAATWLHRFGRRAEVCFLGDAGRLPADAADALAQAQAAGVTIAPAVAEGGAEDFAIDALLGLGSTRAPQGALGAAVAAMNRSPARVLAVDLPSGLGADTGQPLGDAVVRADATLSLLTLKPGLFTGQGRDLAGAVWLDRLGCAAEGATAELATRPALAPRRHAQHKGSFGDVAVVGGAPGMLGAVWLAAGAALAAGAGRVYACPLDDDAPPFDAQRLELMVRRRWWTQPPAALQASTVVCGCGGGDAVRSALPPLLSHAARLVLDADGLNAVAADESLQRLLAARGARGLPTVLTPHPLEAARLLGVGTSEVQGARLAAAQRLAQRFGASVVLKGSGSVIASPQARPVVNPTGNALLASAGTGDVLAGWLGGLWAASGLDAHEAASAAVWLHGRAADAAAAAGTRLPLRAGDLIEAMRSA